MAPRKREPMENKGRGDFLHRRITLELIAWRRVDLYLPKTKNRFADLLRFAGNRLPADSLWPESWWGYSTEDWKAKFQKLRNASREIPCPAERVSNFSGPSLQ